MTELVFGIAERRVRGGDLTIEEALAAMDLIAPYRGEWAALALPGMCCDDADGCVDRRYGEIVARWRAE